MIRYTFLGTSDDHTTCDCCGKSDLKSTVAVHDIENGTDHFFGTTCAARALKIQVAEVRKGTADADKAKRDAEERARAAKARAEAKAWSEWLAATAGEIRDFSGELDVFRMQQRLGGFAAARKLWRESLAAA